MIEVVALQCGLVVRGRPTRAEARRVQGTVHAMFGVLLGRFEASVLSR